MTRRVNRVLQQLRLSLGLRDAGTLSDGQLLRRWAAERDEAAFELLVRRHGPMVLGLCRRLLGHAQDAEDAFQATFLALVRKADSIHKQAAVSSWLYKVAYRVALRARTRSASRPTCSARLEDVAGDPPEDHLWSDLRPVLDEEVSRLPRCFQDVFILCQLQGKTNEEAARQLGCPLGTVVSRLSRARERLRTQLVRRGLTLSAGVVVATNFVDGASAALAPALVSSTSQVALAYAGTGAEAAAISAQVTSLTNGVLKTMFLTKLKIVAAVVTAVCLSGVLTHSLVYRSLAGESREGGFEPVQVEKKAPAEVKWRVLATFEDKAPVQGLAFTPDGQRLVIGNQNGEIRYWSIGSDKGVEKMFGLFQAVDKTVGGPNAGIANLAISPDGTVLVVTEKNGVVVRDVNTGKVRWVHQLADSKGHVAFAPDGQLLAINGKDAVLLLDARTGKQIRHVVAAGQSPSALAFSRDGKLLITGSDLPEVRLWDATSGKEVASLKVPAPIIHVAVSPDGKFLVTADAKGTIHLLDLPTGRTLRMFVAGSGRVSAAAFSPDGKVLAVVGQDPVVRIWDVNSGKQVQLKEHVGAVRLFAFSPDGKTLATGAEDRRIILWRLAQPDVPIRVVVRQKTDHLDRLVKSLIQQNKGNGESIEALYLATLARYPSEVEKNFLMKQLAKAQNRRQEVLDDVLWSLVNTPEFRVHLDALSNRDPRKVREQK